MKYLSLFSGIGGFELGINKAYESNLKQQHISTESEQEKRSQRRLGPSNQYDKVLRPTDRTAPLCIGYSEIDKYAIQVYTRKCCKCANCVYNRSICESVLNAKNQKEKQNSTLEQTPEDANFVSEKNSESNIETTLKNIEVQLKDGKTEILKSIKQSIEKLLGNEGKNCLICMGENVPVVENQKNNSLPLSIKIKTDIKIERNMEQATDTNSPLKEKIQINTKSSAIIATTQKQDTADVLTKIYEKKPCLLNLGDCTKIIVSELPDFDLLVGGFPCQAFSIAGKRGGFDDTRGTLFFDCARILKEKQPRNFILENVKGLLSHDNGRTFKTIINTLTELGYCVEWQVLNAKNFGVPQNRERVFIVGHLGGLPRRKVFPIGGTDEQDGRRVEIIAHKKGYRRNRQTFSPEGITEALDTATGGGRGHHTISRTVRSGGRASPPQSKQNWDTYEYKGRIRRLTPTECERLMGYPETKEYAIMDLCYDQIKNYVSAVQQNPKLQKLVLSVEKKEWKQFAEYVEKYLQRKNQQIESFAQENVSLLKTESEKKPLSNVDYVETKNTKVRQDSGEDSVLLNVLINITEGRITLNGKEELQVNELKQMAQIDGQNVVNLSGSEIMQLVKNVENDSLTKKIKHLMSTTLSDSEIGKIDIMLIILYFYALDVINGFTQVKTQEKNISLGFRFSDGWTAEGTEGKLSDTQRYKTLGNGIVSNVVEEVIKRIIQ